MYLNSRRNLVLRCSIVINVAVLLYAGVQLTGNGGPVAVEWVPLHVDGADRSLNSISEPAAWVAGDASLRAREQQYDDEATTQRKLAPTVATKRSSSSTAASSAVPSEPEPFDLDQQDENALSEATLARLRTLLGCQDQKLEPKMGNRGEFWVLMNYVPADHGLVSCHESITYTTHAGFEFLENVLPLVERWMAPVSVAVHAPDADFVASVDSIRYLRDCTGSDLVRNFVTFHLFFSHGHVPKSIPQVDKVLDTPFNCSLEPPYRVKSSSTYRKQKNHLYPINVARNIAREAALTHYVLASDIELYPSPNLVPRFLNMVARNEKPLNTTTRPRVFPISIFEVSDKVSVPSTKTELQAMLAKRTAIPFHTYVCPNCHKIPEGAQWMLAKETDRMGIFHVGKRRGKFVHWEPIYIGTNMEPFYDERLSWEGKKDKMTQGYILCVKDYDFMILNNAFIVHKPGIKRYHADSKRDVIASRQSKLIMHTILPELKRIFGTRTGCAV